MNGLIISEFLASNDDTIDDEDGEASDYIEIHNPTIDDVDLAGWHLTDDPMRLDKWTFPSVTLPAGGYLVVFASNKNRVVGELHTNFRLAAEGEYLALVDPSLTVAHEYAPAFPQQVTDVSYGVPTGTQTTVLVEAGATAKVHVPVDASFDPIDDENFTGSWLDINFDDTQAGWFDAATGVGYSEVDVPPLPQPGSGTIIANSVTEFNRVQGTAGWRYGYWRKSNDPGGVFDTITTPADFTQFQWIGLNTILPNNHWNGTYWELAVDPNPPHTAMTNTSARPNGTNSSAIIDLPVRRYTVEQSGNAIIYGTLNNADPAGDGIIARIFINGQEVYTSAVINGTSVDYIFQRQLQQNDRIEFVLDPGAANNDLGDTTVFTAIVELVAPTAEPGQDIADSVQDWSNAGIQGANNWRYGYYDRLADPDQTYQAANFIEFPGSFWTGSVWDWPAGNPPWTEIGVTGVHSNGTNNGPLHWAIRRYQAEISGDLTVNWTMFKTNPNGDGVTGRVFHNGVQVDVAAIAGNDTIGVNRTVVITGVQVGDFIDIAHDPTGPGGNPLAPNDGSDGSAMTVHITGNVSLAAEIDTDIETEMRDVAPGLYMRIPFTVDDPTEFDTLTLRMKYDAGFVAYINGQRVVSRNAPDQVAFDAVAGAEREPSDAITYELINLSNALGLLNVGQNMLFIHGLNTAAGDDDFLIEPELVANSLTVNLGEVRYFIEPTPGEPNGFGQTEIGPLFVARTHSPALPEINQPIVVTTTVAETFAPVQTVTMFYRVMYGSEVQLTMVDDGSGNDAVAGDGIYTATIPANIAQVGQMVRWYFRATDTGGRQTRFPLFQDQFDSEQYVGTIYNDPSLNAGLKVIHWFVQNPTNANNGSVTYGSIYYDGEFYDNVRSDIHGQSTQGFPKKSLDIDFPGDHRFKWEDDVRRMKDINLLSNYADKAKLRNTLAYEIHALMGDGYHLAEPVHVRQNGAFHGVFDFVEDGDDRWLERLGLDPEAPLYKMYNTFFDGSSGAEKKTLKNEPNTDLITFINGLAQTGTNLRNFIYDNVNLPAMANYLAGFVMESNRDCCHKNYYAYFDRNETGQWWFLPWDVDLSIGRNWGGFGLSYHDYTIYPDNGLFTGNNNNLIADLFALPEFTAMYLRRIRTLMDEIYGPPGQPYEERLLESRVDYWANLIGADGAADHTKWGQVWSSTVPQQPFETWPEAVEKIRSLFLEPRRNYLYNVLAEQPVGGGDPPVTLISGDVGVTNVKYFIPTNDTLGTTWTLPGFNDASWASGPQGLGFENTPENYASLLRTTVRPNLVNASATTFMTRIPFTVADPGDIENLTLRVKYDDAFVAYVNGVEVARRGFTGTPTWTSVGTNRDEGLAVQYENILINSGIPVLNAGSNNVLAIHVINQAASSSDMLLVAELVDGLISGGGGGGPIPLAQQGNPLITFGAYEHNPASGDQDEEYVTLINSNSVAVDISGWTLDDGIDHVFPPGTVIPAGGTLYLTPDIFKFRARVTGPRGGQGLYVQGNYSGNLAFGETVRLEAKDGNVVSTLTVPQTDHQKYLRVTEVMYNPPAPTQAEMNAGFFDRNDFEFIELKNTSDSVTLNLGGVQLSNGVTFDFTLSGVTSLAPGQYVVVVSNRSAFELRYNVGSGSNIQIAGQYAGRLDNAGENIEIDGPQSEPIHDFTYDDDGLLGWTVLADGQGHSLDIIDPLAAESSWNDPASWRPSGIPKGTPGRPDPVDGALPGDANYNNVVDISDLSALALWFGAGNTLWYQGDFNGDGVTTISDLSILAARFGQTGGAAAGGGAVDLLAEASPAANASTTDDTTAKRTPTRTVKAPDAVLLAPAIEPLPTATPWRHIVDVLNL